MSWQSRLALAGDSYIFRRFDFRPQARCCSLQYITSDAASALRRVQTGRSERRMRQLRCSGSGPRTSAKSRSCTDRLQVQELQQIYRVVPASSPLDPNYTSDAA